MSAESPGVARPATSRFVAKPGTDDRPPGSFAREELDAAEPERPPSDGAG